ncbi:MAG: MBL fold metallo-hydrolase [Bacteroidota bacterium]
MEIKSFVFSPLYENTYVVWDNTKKALIVDPGCYERYEFDEIMEFISEQKLEIKAIVNTHCHIDHVLGNQKLKNHYKVPLLIPQNEANNLRAVEAYAPNWGITHYDPATPDHLIENEGSISFGNTDLEVIYAPGHSPGHQVFYMKKENKLIGGDVLFRESIGRTDLPGGDHAALIENIKEKLFMLPDETVVYPGHGPTTTIGYEKKHNPFVKA